MSSSLCVYKSKVVTMQCQFDWLQLFCIRCVGSIRYVVFAGILRTILRTVFALIISILSHTMYPFPM